jgi:predicted permease
MLVFQTILLRLLPLYAVIVLGYLAGRFLLAQRETVAAILIYILAPVVMFDGAYTVSFSGGILLLPLLFWFLCSLLCVCWYAVASHIWKDATKNLLAFTAGTGNTGYFGLPVAVAIFSPKALGIMTLSLLGFVLYEQSFGFAMVAKGNHTTRESILKAIRLPTLYASVLGLMLNAFHAHLGGEYARIAVDFRGAYSVLGMLMVGIGMVGAKRKGLDARFLTLAFIAKFVVWPLLVGAVIFLDVHVFHLFDTFTHRVMFLLSIVPMAANTVVFASVLRVHPEKAAASVFLSTLFALLFIPLAVALFL